MIKKIAFFLNLMIIINTSLYSMEEEQSKTDKHINLIAILNPWKLLGIKKGASTRQISDAYHKLVSQHSPDTSRFNSGSTSGYMYSAYNNAMNHAANIRVKEIDKYIIIKKLHEIFKKQESDRTIMDDFLLSLLRRFKMEETLLLDPENYDALSTFINKYEENLNKASMRLNKIVKACDLIYYEICENKLPYINMAADVIHSFHEAYRISTLGSHHNEKIKKAAQIGRIFHILSALKTPLTLLNAIGIEWLLSIPQYFNMATKAIPINKAVALARFSNVLPGLSALKFAKQDAQIQKDSSRIAQYNKITKRNLTATKLKQLIWLGINKIVPYAGFGLVKRMRNKIALSDFFNTQESSNFMAIDNKLAGQVFSILKAISNVSEIARKYYRYKAEMGNYKNYKYYTNNLK